MMLKGRAVGLVLGVIALVASGAAGLFYVQQTKEHQSRVAVEQQLARVSAERDDVTEQLQSMKQAKAQVEDELGRAKTRLDEAGKQLAEEQAAKEALAKSVDERQDEIDRLTKDLQQAKTDRATVESQLSKAKSDQDKLQQQVAQLQKDKDDLEAKTKEAAAVRPSVELEKVVVGSSASGSTVTPASATAATAPVFEQQQNMQFMNATTTSTAPSSGQVLVVNREYDFVVVNLGRNQGLQIGQEFQVVRGTDVLGRVKVEKVYDELSAAAIQPDSQKDKIREGDQVKAI